MVHSAEVMGTGSAASSMIELAQPNHANQNENISVVLFRVGRLTSASDKYVSAGFGFAASFPADLLSERSY